MPDIGKEIEAQEAKKTVRKPGRHERWYQAGVTQRARDLLGHHVDEGKRQAPDEAQGHAAALFPPEADGEADQNHDQRDEGRG